MTPEELMELALKKQEPKAKAEPTPLELIEQSLQAVPAPPAPAPPAPPPPARDIPWYIDLPLAAASYGITAAALAPTGVGVLGTSAAAAPVYMAARQYLTGRPYTPREALEEEAWWTVPLLPFTKEGRTATRTVARKVWERIPEVEKDIIEQAAQSAARLGSTAWENITFKPQSLAARALPPMEKLATKIREALQPAVERLEETHPKVARTFREAYRQRSLVEHTGRELTRELSRLAPREQYEVLRGLRGAPLEALSPKAQNVILKYTKTLSKWDLDTAYQNAFETAFAKHMFATFRERPVESVEAVADIIDKEMGKVMHPRLYRWQWERAAKRIIESPHVDDMTKAIAKDLWNIQARTPKEVADAANAAMKSWLVEKLKRTKGLVSVKPKEGYVQSTFGELRGLYIPKDVELELRALNEIPRVSASLVNKFFMTPWKTAKVILRLATHFRNMYSNLILNDIGGLSFLRLDVYSDALKKMIKKSPEWIEFQKRSGIAPTFSARDLYVLDEGLRYGANMFDKLYYIFDKVTAPARGIYGAEEAWFKFAKYLHNLEKGMPKSDAVLDAVRWTFNYGEITPTVAKLRTYAHPFATWYVKAIPQFLWAAANHPIRVGKWIMAGLLLQQYAIDKAGMSHDEWAAFKKQLPDYIQNGLFLLLPWRDQKGRLQMLNLTYILPGLGDLSEIQQRLGGIPPKSPAGIAQLLTSNPIPATIGAIMYNRRFTGIPIWYEWENPSTKFTKAAAYIWEVLSPAMLPGGTDWKTLERVLEEHPEAPTPGQAIASWFGFKVTPIEPAEVVRRREALEHAMRREMAIEMQRELRHATSDEERQRILQKYYDILAPE